MTYDYIEKIVNWSNNNEIILKDLLNSNASSWQEYTEALTIANQIMHRA